MDKPKDNIRVVDDFDIALSLDNRLEGGRQVTNIDLSVQPLVLRVSFRDIFLINSIVNSAIAMSNRTVTPIDNPPRVPPKTPNLRRISTGDSGKPSSRNRRRSSVSALQAQVIVSKETASPLPPHSFFVRRGSN